MCMHSRISDTTLFVMEVMMIIVRWICAERIFYSVCVLCIHVHMNYVYMNTCMEMYMCVCVCAVRIFYGKCVL